MGNIGYHEYAQWRGLRWVNAVGNGFGTYLLSQHVNQLVHLGTQKLDTGNTQNPNAIIEVITGGGEYAQFYLRGALKAVSELQDPQAVFGTSARASDHNIYHNGTRYILQNNSGSAESYGIWYRSLSK